MSNNHKKEPERPNGEYAVIKFKVRVMWCGLIGLAAAVGTALIARILNMLMGHG